MGSGGAWSETPPPWGATSVTNGMFAPIVASPASPTTLVLAAVWFAVGAGAVAFVAVRVARAVAPEDGLVRATVAVLIGLAQVVGVPLLLAMAGVLGPEPALGLHLVLALVVWRLVRPPDAVREEGDADRRGGAVAAGVGVALASLALIPALLGRLSEDFESRHYHIANLASWLQRESLWPLPFQNPAFATATHPGNGETVGLWLALPTHGDHSIYVGNVAFGLLAVLAVALLARRLGGRAWVGALGAIAVLGTPVLFGSQAHSLGTDLAAAGPLIAAVAFLHLAVREGPRPWLWLAGVAAGLAVGSKYSAMVPAALLLAGAAVVVRPTRDLWRLLPGLALFAGPWLLRNALATGNPIFPQGVEALGWPGYSSPLESISGPLLGHLARFETAALAEWIRLLWRLWGPVVLLLPLGAVAALRSRDRRWLGVLAMAWLLAYASTPFTGQSQVMGINTRYALPAVLLGVALASASLPKLLLAPVIGVALVFDAVHLLDPETLRRPDLELGWGALVAAALGAAAWLAWNHPPKLGFLRSRPAAVAAVLAAALGATMVATAGGRAPTPLEQEAVRPYYESVVSIGVFDLRSLLGPRLNRRLVAIAEGGAAGEDPYEDAVAFQDALDRLDPSIIVVSLIPAVGVPAGWRPSPDDWCDVGGSADAHVYLHIDPDSEDCPPAELQ